MRTAIKQYSIEKGLPEIDTAIELTAKGFNRPVDAELTEDVESHINSGDNFYFVNDENGKNIAYSIFSQYKTAAGEVLYLSGVIIDPPHQGKGISRDIVNTAIEEHEPDYLCFRTQSVRMYEAGRKMVEVLYPRIEETKLGIPDDIMTAGERMAEIIGGQFPITKGCYGGKPLYGERPDHYSSEEFYRYCNFSKGDAILFVGKPLVRQADYGSA
jgi:GNAT superfamily N-acetyltransferase